MLGSKHGKREIRHKKILKVYLEPEECEEFLRAIGNEEVRKFVCVAAHTGLRRSELYYLKPENFKAPYIILPNTTKSRKPRTVPLIEELHDTLTLPWDCAIADKNATVPAGVCTNQTTKSFMS